MTKYKIFDFGLCGSIVNPGRLLKNTLNVLLGASLAMKFTNHSLKTTHVGEGEIFFETNHINFVQGLAVELSNYGIRIEKIN